MCGVPDGVLYTDLNLYMVTNHCICFSLWFLFWIIAVVSISAHYDEENMLPWVSLGSAVKIRIS